MVLERVFVHHPEFLNFPLFVFIANETAVTEKCGEKAKMINPYSENAGGYRIPKGRGIGIHLAAVFLVNADRMKHPPFIIFHGKNEQNNGSIRY